jgi:hypothetical protein
MQRDVLLLTEMIEAAGQAQELTSGVTASAVRCSGTSPCSAKPQANSPTTSHPVPRGQLATTCPAAELDRPRLLVSRHEILHTAARDQLSGFQADLERVLATLDEST